MDKNSCGGGFRKPSGLQLGFSEKANDGKTKFLFVNYFEEKSDMKEDIDLIRRLDKKWRSELVAGILRNPDHEKWVTNKETLKVDAGFRRILKKFQKTAYFR